MAINKQPVARKCRALGVSPAEMGYGKKQSKRNPGGTRRKKVSEYGAQLKEKQKATNMKGITGDNMLQLLELRLDNVVYRLGLGKTRRAARQIVVHGHIRVNGQKVDIPSYSVKVGDVITLRQKSTESELFKPLREGTSVVTPKWLTFDAPNLTGKVVALPTREDVSLEAEMSMIVEFYSR